MSSEKLKPFLRWAGSKRKLLPKLEAYWNNSFNRYIEPFMGSASLFFSIGPKRALLSDINSDLINAYRVVKRNPNELYERLQRLPKGEKAYYEIRSKYTEQVDVVDKAARFIYLNRFCFNGIYRTNLKGEFNVPYAPSGTGDLPKEDHLVAISKALRNTKIICDDFEKVLLNEVCEGDFVYLDPPYAVANRRVFRQYGPEIFGLEDIERMRNVLKGIEKSGAKFLVSYALCKEAMDAFSEWTIRRVQTQRNVAGFSRHRRRAIEMLITNIN